MKTTSVTVRLQTIDQLCDSFDRSGNELPSPEWHRYVWLQELLRHANLKVTMDTYVQAVSDEKRKAQGKVVEMLLPGIRKAAR